MSDEHGKDAVERLTNGAGAPPGPPPLHIVRVDGMWLVGVLSSHEGAAILAPAWELERRIRVERGQLLTSTYCNPLACLPSCRGLPLKEEQVVLLLPLAALSRFEQDDITQAIAACVERSAAMMTRGVRTTAGAPRIIVPGS